MSLLVTAEEYLKRPARGTNGAHVVGVLFMLGGFLALISLALPHPDTGEAAIWGVIVAGATAGGLLLAFGDRVSYLMLNAAVAFGSILINAVALASGVAAGVYAGMFCWVVLVSVNFFSHRAAALHFAFMMATFAIVLTMVRSGGDYSALTRWLTTTLALGVTWGAGAWLVFLRRLAEEEANRFLELSNEMICTIGRDGRFVNLNPAWAKTLGQPLADLCREPVVELVHPLDRPGTEEALAQLRDGTEALTIENRCRTGSGNWKRLRWTATFADDESVIYARVEPLGVHDSLLKPAPIVR